MPFPICQHHALKLFDRMRPDVPETAREFWDIWTAHVDAQRPEWDAERLMMAQLQAEQSVVYYVKTGEFIKIGVTCDLRQRLTAMRLPQRDVLATEPGMRDAERQRHLQFAHLRQGRTEDFTPAPELLDLIAKLLAQFGPPKITDSFGLRSEAERRLAG